ncbi:amino acid ABC transporter substrate-binding protein [Spirochaetia bacterium]|nr:amino acid ABC transporter substrate-binding protein [Spirochaetia bacterium]
MKRIVVVVMCLVGAATGLFANGTAAGRTSVDTSLSAVMSKGTFVLGLDDSFPPMGFRNEANEIVGYDIDLAKEVTRRIGVTLKAQPIDWNAKEQELNTGEIDCIWNGFTITDERKESLTFSPPYLANAQVVVVKSATSYRNLADLAGKVVGTQAGSSSVEAIDDAPAFKASVARVIEYKDFLTALMDLDVGGVDAIVIDLVVANDNIQRSGKAFRILDETLGAEEFGIGFRKNDKALANKVWETLLEMAKDGTVAQITAKWFGSDISVIGK